MPAKDVMYYPARSPWNEPDPAARYHFRSGFLAMVSEHAGAEILAYLLDLQFRRIPIDIMATGVQAD
jgi:hypothetical protein